MDTAKPTPKPQDTARTQTLIKRYANRKLYDTSLSKYVTLEDIAQMVKSGAEVHIVDNETKEDLTSLTLTQIILEQERRENHVSSSMLRSWIMHGGATIQELFERSVLVPATEIREAAQKSIAELTESTRRLFNRENRDAEEFRRRLSELDKDLATVSKRLVELQELIISARFHRPNHSTSMPLKPKSGPN